MSRQHDGTGKFTVLTRLFYDMGLESSLTQKSQLIRNYLNGNNGDKYLAVKFLLCKEDLRVYNLNNKTLVKVAAEAFDCDYDEMRDHLDEGDVSNTLSFFLGYAGQAASYSTVSLKQVDTFLDSLTNFTKHSDQVKAFKSFCNGRLTDIDILWLTRLIKKDLKVGSGSRTVLDAVSSKAYDDWKRSSNLEFIVKKTFGIPFNEQNVNQLQSGSGSSSSSNVPSTLDLHNMYQLSDSDGDDDDRLGEDQRPSDDESDGEGYESDKTEEFCEDDAIPILPSTSTSCQSTSIKGADPTNIPDSKKRKRGEDVFTSGKSKASRASPSITLGIPVRPQLAQAVKTYDEILQKCPNGFYADMKIDGERIQIHKDGESFQYWSRNLKPITDYKICDVKEYIEKATDAKRVILDGEIAMISTKTGEALPFGALGKHKRKTYGNEEDCVVGIYLFDILYLEGKSLLDLPYQKRRRLLKKLIKPIEHRVMIAKTQLIDGPEEERQIKLAERMNYMINNNYEGLVIKDIYSIYEPKARHWFKMKKMNLQGMVDTIDACVVGGYYGTGRLSGKIAVFLMAVRDEKGKMWTVCKVGNGCDDDTIEKLTKYFTKRMDKIQGDHSRIPSWLECDRTHTPDLILRDLDDTKVFEVAGAEFSESPQYPLQISIRFPYVQKIRDDKDLNTSTDVKLLKQLYEESKKKKPTTKKTLK